MKYIIIPIIILFSLNLFIQKNKKMTLLSPNDSILSFGDSLTYGFGASTQESYPALLSNKTGLKRLAPYLEDPSVKLMILFFGGNDILQKKSMTALKANLKTMIGMAKARNIDVLLVAVPNITLFGLSALDLYEETAEEEEVPLLSGMLADILSDPSLKSDQIHPNAQGYSVMAEKIFESLKEQGWIP